MTDDAPTAALISRLDFDLQDLFRMVERLCREAHLDDDDIAEILAEGDADRLEIITDTADEVLVKATNTITEARLAIQSFRRAAK